MVGSWFWLERPVRFEQQDVYGIWMNDSPRPTTLEFKHDGVVIVSGSPLPEDSDWKGARIFGESEWGFLSSAETETTWVSIGTTAKQALYAENSWFSTSLVLYIGDPDLPGSRIVFTRTASLDPQPTPKA